MQDEHADSKREGMGLTHLRDLAQWVPRGGGGGGGGGGLGHMQPLFFAELAALLLYKLP